jgi:DNA-binding winged helix-turn-helix (wHTH) protein
MEGSESVRPEEDFRLGEWLVQPALGRICRGDQVTSLRPRLMDLLVLLARSQGQVVSKQQILDTLWVRGFVSDSLLTRCMAELRSILGDDAREPTFIETIPKRGYRVVAPCSFATSGEEPSSTARESCLRLIIQREVVLVDGESLIGRGEDCLIRLDSRNVSRHHARLVVSGDRVAVEDLGSKNGTWLNGRRIEGTHELEDGDELAIGQSKLVFSVRGPAAAGEPAE